MSCVMVVLQAENTTIGCEKVLAQVYEHLKHRARACFFAGDAKLCASLPAHLKALAYDAEHVISTSEVGAMIAHFEEVFFVTPEGCTRFKRV